MTIVDLLRQTASDGHGELIVHLDDGEERATTRELLARATARAAYLHEQLGFRRGDRLGLLGPNRVLWAEWAYATWLAGGTLVPLQFPLRLRDPAAFATRVGWIAATSGCRVIAADPKLLPTLAEHPVVPWDVPLPPATGEPAGARPDDVGVIQFTSGSTAAPKGVMLTHAAILAERTGFVEARRCDRRDRAFSWLPFFHDWGLFNYLIMPLSFGFTGHVLPTERFARDPALWLRGMSSVRATFTGGPPSAWTSALQTAARDPHDIDLTSVRYAALSAEGIDADAADGIVSAAGRFGLRPTSFAASYGLAEATLCVTSGRLDTGLRWDTIDLEASAAGRATPARPGRRTKRVVSCGTPVAGYEVEIRGAHGALPERTIGEIVIRGPGMMRGYLDATDDPFVDGWLRTGDLGYLADGELYVSGRQKDLVIVFGQNYHPDDFEWAAGRVDGVRSGRSVAFADPRTEGKVVLVVEPEDGAEPSELGASVRIAVTDAIGIAPADVVVASPGTIEKTTSGKLRRIATRDAYVRGDLAP